MVFLNGAVFNIQGGGVTRHERCKTYVDLIVGDLSAIGNQHPQLADLFKTFALHRQGEANFGYAELTSDDRLQKELESSSAGKELYADVLEKMPLISISNDILGNPKNTKNVSLIRLEELNDNPIDTMNRIYNLIREEEDISPNRTVKKIEELNKILNLKPSIFGLGVNVNQLIDQWVKQKKKTLKKQ